MIMFKMLFALLFILGWIFLLILMLGETHAMTKYSGIRDAQVEEIPYDPNNILHEDDNVDVAATGGSDSFHNFDNDKDGSNTPDISQIEISNSPNTIQSGIRQSPNASLNESYDEEIEFIPDDVQEEKKEPEPVQNLSSLRKQYSDLGGNDVAILASKSQEIIQNAINDITEAKALIQADEELKQSRKTSAEKQAQKLESLKQEYKDLGGTNENISNSKTQKPIIKAIQEIKSRLEDENRQELQNLKHQYTELGGDDINILQNNEKNTIQDAIKELQDAREEAILQIQQQKIKKPKKNKK